MTDRTSAIRIGNAQAFWGDRTEAAAELVAQVPDLDYLTLDYLAEVSMSILAVQRERDPAAGFARDFIGVVASLAPYWSAGGRCRLITNAGGLNPRGCAAACKRLLEEAGCREMRIGVVSGDDVLVPLRTDPENPAFDNLDTGAPLSSMAERLVTANAYLGAAPIVDALQQGAEIVITGRVADPSLILAPCIHHFGWRADEWDKLAGGTVAGHLVECGTQVTGGISTDWLQLDDPAHIGFPVVEVSGDGSCVVTKPPASGGSVDEFTVKEQLLYEIGDPARYLSPDVSVSFLTIRVEDQGNGRVRVSGAAGTPPPEKLKVSATCRDGYRAAGTLTIVGQHAVTKAQRCGEIVLQRLDESGCKFRDTLVECLGSGACLPDALSRGNVDVSSSLECVLRIAVESESREDVDRFSRELMPLITAGPQGTTGYAEGRPRVHPVFRYWPCLIDRDQVSPKLEIVSVGPPPAAAQVERGRITSNASSKAVPRKHGPDRAAPVLDSSGIVRPSPAAQPRRLRDVARARSGDKGTGANVGVIARSPECYPMLCDWLTVERVAAFFGSLGVESVERFELPNLHALNFLLHGVLRRSLRTDAQGKALGQALLEMPIPDNAS